jgi:cellulose synthase operon protein YhjQ
MDSYDPEKPDDLASGETPEDVAALYSWANLHGAKYRDFSASRREDRAQLRHRAASQQVRDQALLARAEAEAAPHSANTAERETVKAVKKHLSSHADPLLQPPMHEVEYATRSAATERVEVARRAEAAAVAQLAARREEREIAEAHASAQRQAARYADSEMRRKASRTTPNSPQLASSPPRRPQGYRPDNASGVRQIYREHEYDISTNEPTPREPLRSHHPASGTTFPAFSHMKSTSNQAMPVASPSSLAETEDAAIPTLGKRRTDLQPQRNTRQPPAVSKPFSQATASDSRPATADHSNQSDLLEVPLTSNRVDVSAASPPRAVSPFSQALVPPDSTRGRRAQDDFDYQQSTGSSDRERTSLPKARADITNMDQPPSILTDPAGPAWLYAPRAAPASDKPSSLQTTSQSSVADTLQHSRERVAARWFALKGVFQQPGQEQVETAPIRQKETRTPVLAVFSFAGGVGKTSLVATVGRSLSSLGEKVLLTDTTSHGLLPYYFGASELREGTVRTFSPPSGSTDAPIYMVSYDVEQTPRDDSDAEELLADKIINNSRGTHRVLLDLNPSTSWIVRRLFRMNPTILVPVAPDMNSVISLQTVEKFFHGINDGEGRPLQPFYVLNQFDTSLPLHLDVREVLRRQLGDRLLPFVIRRAPSVSEALAEGMTVVDYAPDAPISEDYLNVATWLRTIAAPATAGFRNVRWSER